MVIAEDTCHVAAAWGEDGAVIAAEAVIEGMVATMLPDHSGADHEAADAEVTAVAPEEEEVTAQDLATTVDTTTDHLRRTIRWVAIRALDTTRDHLRDSSLTHDNRRTRPR